MTNIKDAAKRVSALAGALALLLGTSASLIPASASADALNPLTERSLMLSSAAPGYVATDGSGNSTYAPPGSGPNGKQTTETFSFKVSTNSTNSGTNATNTPVKAFTLQYCTTPAGTCTAPGNDVGAVGSRTDSIANHQSDLDVNYPTPNEVSALPSSPAQTVARNDSDGNFAVIVGGTLSSGWTLSTDTLESTPTTGKHNLVTLTNSTGIQPASGTQIKIILYADDTNYTTNPGASDFFVKINDYDTTTSADLNPTTSTHIVDGGVTVANVMNDSIQIQTKVLETMSFSVGTVNPDTIINGDDAGLGAGHGYHHGTCDSISTNNPIQLGDSVHEYSLSTTQAYDAHSYWRLSSNSSNGATVYYTGATLSDTEGDQIAPINNTHLTQNTFNGPNNGVLAASHVGTEQFGLAIDSTPDTLDTTDTPGLTDTLLPLVATTNYAGGAGTLVTNGTAQFAFDQNANTVPVPIATESTSVIHCSTGKMRYVANIAPDTPAGIYTTKVNYIAAPEY